ncbi:hypothetical protein REPUB_Repub11eG0113400 [Reevesia pubescens]
MASSSKKSQEDNNKTKKEKQSNGISAKETKTSIKKPDKKASTTEKPNKSKPKSKPDNNKNKSSNGTLVESEVIADPSSTTESKEQQNEKKTNKNVKPNKRKQKEKVVENGEAEEDEEAKMCKFPMNRIKRIMKTEDSRMALSQDVVFLVNKATEKFLEKFCEDGYNCSVKDRKKSLSYKHLSTVVRERKRYDFLSDYVPEKIKAEDALKERNSTETGAK